MDAAGGAAPTEVVEACGAGGAAAVAAACRGLQCEIFLGTAGWEASLDAHELVVRLREAALVLRRQRAEALLQREGVGRTLRGGVVFCKEFMDHLASRNRLQEFILRSMEDFAAWISRISRSQYWLALERGGPAGAMEALSVVQRRLVRVIATEALVNAGLSDSMSLLHAMAERCTAADYALQEAAPEGRALTMARLAGSLARLATNVISFESVSRRCANLAHELLVESQVMGEELVEVARRRRDKDEFRGLVAAAKRRRVGAFGSWRRRTRRRLAGPRAEPPDG